MSDTIPVPDNQREIDWTHRIEETKHLLSLVDAKLGALVHWQQHLHAVQLDTVYQNILTGDPRYGESGYLNSFECKIFSQCGEDGIIAEIFRRLGSGNRRFVEFGVEVGLENNTAALLLQGWKGLWIEPVAEFVSRIKEGYAPMIQAGRLAILEAAVTADNVEELFRNADVPSELDLLSIDIDGNDYWVWDRVRQFHPRVVVIEYNATFPPPIEWIMRPEPEYRWAGTIKFGASLESLVRLGQEKGYSLVGCSIGGANAFFVRSDLIGDHFQGPFTASRFYEPPRYYLAGRTCGHRRDYAAVQAPLAGDTI